MSALGAIAQTMISCDYAVPAPPEPSLVVDPNLTNLVYDDGAGGYSLLLQSEGEPCDRGWRFTDATRTAIEICGLTCDLIRNGRDARLAVVFGCQTGAVPVVR